MTMLHSEWPCVDKISFEWGDQTRDVTWEVVGKDAVRAPVVEDQKWMV
jgi:hypothetical protein